MDLIDEQPLTGHLRRACQPRRRAGLFGTRQETHGLFHDEEEAREL